MNPGPGSRIDIDAEALQHNVTALRDELAPAHMVMVVKADAYGHGVDPIVPIAMDAGIDEFAVFSVHEADQLLDAAPGATVQVMGHVGQQWPWAAAKGVQPWLADIAQWPLAKEAAQQEVANGGQPLRIHVEVETGMHRTGLVPDNALDVLREAQDDPAVEVVGLCTHLAGAEDRRNLARVEGQVARFEAVVKQAEAEGIPIPPCHVASSSAALLHPELRMDVVRVGIASYGLWPTPEVRERFLAQQEDSLGLRRVMTWRSTIMAVQDVAAGECIGYGSSHTTTHDTRVAVVPVGYSDGLTRRLSNAGYLLVHGQRCPIVGPVNMNMVQIDVGHLVSAEPGDDVVLIGAQGDDEIGVHSFAEAQEVVDYEFMARLDKDIPRVAIRPPLAPGN